MKTVPSALLGLVCAVLPLAITFAQSVPSRPTAVIIEDDFDRFTLTWDQVSGFWRYANGGYENTSREPDSIAVINSYPAIQPDGEGEPVVVFDDFTVSARMRNQGTADTHLVGLVYGYWGPQDYNEVIVSATGKVRMRTVLNGIAVDEFPAIDAHIPRNTWFDVEVRWNNGRTSVKVNGLGIVQNVAQQQRTTGQIGFVAHDTLGRFDKMYLGTPFGDQEFIETFDDAPVVTFTPQSGQWSVVNGTYGNSAVQQTNVTLAPIATGPFPEIGDTTEYTFRARMLNPYGNPGNQVGIVFNYQGTAYTEVVFSSKGIIELNRVANRVKHTIATASYSTAPNRAFNVAVENGPGHFAVILNDRRRLFESVNIVDVNPNQIPDGGVGLITHRDPGRFDNIEFSHGFFTPCSVNFGEEPPVPMAFVTNGTWNRTGGTLSNETLNSTDIGYFVTCSGAGGNYTARLRNEYGASGNRVGLIYDYQKSGLYRGEYYEVTFSPTGVVQMNKFVQGVLSPVRTASYPIPGKAFFTVQVIRASASTQIKVNGAIIVESEAQRRMGDGLGVVTHWTKGHFDDVKIIDSRTGGPPSEL